MAWLLFPFFSGCKQLFYAPIRGELQSNGGEKIPIKVQDAPLWVSHLQLKIGISVHIGKHLPSRSQRAPRTLWMLPGNSALRDAREDRRKAGTAPINRLQCHVAWKPIDSQGTTKSKPSPCFLQNAPRQTHITPSFERAHYFESSRHQ